MITQDELKAVWDYNPEKDEFYWKIKRKGTEIGNIVDTSNRNIRILGGRYTTKSLINIYINGSPGHTKVSNPITYTELLNVLTYNKETGDFIWNEERNNGITKGSPAGCIKPDKYVVITIGTKYYYAHRLAWLYTYKVWPDGIIDHIDRNPSNNAIINLRDTGYAENRFNSSLQINNTTGYVGVVPVGPKYRAQIKYNGEMYYLGTHNTPEEANLARETFILEQGISR